MPRIRSRVFKGQSYNTAGRLEESRYTASDPWRITYQSADLYLTRNMGFERITDEVQYGDNHPMKIERVRVVQNLVTNMTKELADVNELNGPRITTKNLHHGGYYDYTSQGGFDPSVYMAPAISQPSDAVLVAKLLAKTNPSVPMVSLPNFGHEMRELPDLVRNAGRNFINRAATANLQINFGLSPMIGDLLKLHDFTQEADKLFKSLNAARKRGLRRTRTLWEGSNSTSTTLQLSNDYWLQMDGTRSIERKRSIKGHVRWIPDKTFPRSDDELRRRIKQSMLGLSTDSANLAMIAWEAMPWTWLIDWFANTGDLMKRDINTLGMKPTGIRLMENDVSNLKLIPKQRYGRRSWMFTSPHLSTYEQKVRRIPSNLGAIPVDIKLPLFDIRQLGILASLFVIRSGRYPDPEPGLAYVIGSKLRKK